MNNKLKSTLMFFFISLLSISLSLAGEGSSAGNGGGISENNILQSRLDLDKYYEQMLKIPEIRLTTKERNLLRTIKQRLSLESRAKFIFKREKDYDFKGKMVSTLPEVGADVVFNLDALYILSEKEERIPFTLAHATSLLTSILQRGNDLLSANEMKVLSGKIEEFFETASVTFSLKSLKREEIQVSILDWKKSSEILLMDSMGVTNATAHLTAGLLCDQGTKQLIKMRNVFMENKAALEGNIQKVTYKASIDYRCGTGTLSGEISLTVPYVLSSKDRNVRINDSWWSNGRIDSALKLKDIKYSFHDIH